MTLARLFAALIVLVLPALPALAQPLTLFTAGAYKAVVQAVVPDFEARSGLKVTIVSDTAGGLVRRVEAGEAFDVVVLSHEGAQRLAGRGAVADGSVRRLAQVGIGVGVPEGTPTPPLGSVEDFVAMLRAARAVAYIDPASGGSSGIYLDGLFTRLKIADVVRPKAVLVPGGIAAERVARGEADVVLQQASEILGVRGVALAGLLPDEVQAITTYSGALSPRGASNAGARALLEALAPPAEVLRARGMAPAAR